MGTTTHKQAKRARKSAGTNANDAEALLEENEDLKAQMAALQQKIIDNGNRAAELE